MRAHNLCFEQSLEKHRYFSSQNCHFHSRKNSSILHRCVKLMSKNAAICNQSLLPRGQLFKASLT